MKTKRRNKGEGSITKLANGRYKVVITLGVGIDGKQKRKTKTVDSKAAAVTALKELNTTYRTSHDTTQALQSLERFGDFCTKFLEQKKLTVTARTYHTYTTKSMYSIYNQFKDLKMKDITTAMINSALLAMKERGLKHSSINIYKNALSTIFKDAVTQNIITRNPVSAAIKLPTKTTKNELELPTKDELDKLLKLLKEEDYTLYVIVLLAISTGLRRGEILGLKWNNVDTVNNIIHVKAQATQEGRERPLKTSSSYRSIYVNASVMSLLATLRKEDDIYVFPYASPAAFSSRIRYFFDKAGLAKTMTFHDLRHYHATQLIMKGINIKAISKRLGHSDTTTTMNVYIHYIKSMDIEASDLIGSDYII